MGRRDRWADSGVAAAKAVGPPRPVQGLGADSLRLKHRNRSAQLPIPRLAAGKEVGNLFWSSLRVHPFSHVIRLYEAEHMVANLCDQFVRNVGNQGNCRFGLFAGAYAIVDAGNEGSSSISAAKPERRLALLA